MSKKTTTSETVVAESTVETVNVNTSSAKTKETVKKSSTVVYIGPSIKNVVEHGTIFNNGLTSLLEKAIETKPLLKGLVVSIDDLAQARAELRKPGSTYYTLYKKAQE